MDVPSLINLVIPYLERSGMSTLVVVCASAILIASTVFVVAWIIDQKSTKNLFRGVIYIVDFSVKRLHHLNKSPYDSEIINSKIFQVIEFSYLYFTLFIFFLFGVGTIIIGLFGEANVWWGNIIVICIGVLIIIFSRFIKISADKAHYRFKNGVDWDEKA